MHAQHGKAGYGGSRCRREAFLMPEKEHAQVSTMQGKDDSATKQFCINGGTQNKG